MRAEFELIRADGIWRHRGCFALCSLGVPWLDGERATIEVSTSPPGRPCTLRFTADGRLTVNGSTTFPEVAEALREAGFEIRDGLKLWTRRVK